MYSQASSSKSSASPSSPASGSKFFMVAIAVILAAAAGAIAYKHAGGRAHSYRTDKPQEAATPDKRAQAYNQAMEKGHAQIATWPKTERELVLDFWGAVRRKDYERLTLLCPGSIADDYSPYCEKWTPEPPSAIGNPEANPSAPNFPLIPVKVSFPGFPNKTIKMALVRAQDGRLIIDGDHTIWW